MTRVFGVSSVMVGAALHTSAKGCGANQCVHSRPDFHRRQRSPVGRALTSRLQSQLRGVGQP